MISTIIPIVGSLLTRIIDKLVPDKTQALEMQTQALKILHEEGTQELNAAVSIITAEVQGESWLQRNWRPMLMIWFAGLIGAHWLGFTPPNLPETVQNALLDIVQVGIGGYVIGRSAEKAIKEWKK